jgi:hypothetical protein
MRTHRRNAISSAARTAAVASSVIDGSRWRGIRIFLDITAASGTGGLKVILRAASGAKRAALNAGGTALVATGLKLYEIYPDAAAAAVDVADAVSRRLPAAFDIQVTHDDSSSYTYSVDYELLP